MIYQDGTMEAQAALAAAAQICAAARTAPKTRGIDKIHTLVVTGEEKDALATELRRLGETKAVPSFIRDAANLDLAQALVLVGTTEGQRGLGRACGYCHMGDCDGCAKSGGTCVFDAMDLGIALGSAVALAADMRVDTRIMYSVGKAALSLGLMDEQVKIVVAIPISVSGKSPFFDRKA